MALKSRSSPPTVTPLPPPKQSPMQSPMPSPPSSVRLLSYPSDMRFFLVTHTYPLRVQRLLLRLTSAVTDVNPHTQSSNSKLSVCCSGYRGPTPYFTTTSPFVHGRLIAVLWLLSGLLQSAPRASLLTWLSFRTTSVDPPAGWWGGRVGGRGGGGKRGGKEKEERPKGEENAKVSIFACLFYPFTNLTKYRSPSIVAAATTARSGFASNSPPLSPPPPPR